MKDLISIIVPVYNVEQYLRQCLDSLISQTYENIEIIIIDDGSEDGSGAICDEYAGRDGRIVVSHIGNQGLSEARNTGIGMAKGRYLMFADSDDTVEPEFCELPYKAAVENDADIVMFPYAVLAENGTEVNVQSFREGPVDKHEALDHLLFGSIGCALWNKLYKKELFSGVEFPADRYYEDAGTTYKLVLAAGRICVIRDALYNYRTSRAGSITSSREQKQIKDKLDMYRQRADALREFGYSEEKNEVQEVEAALSCLIHLPKDKYEEDLAWCRDKIKATKILSSRYSSLIQKKGRMMIRLFKLSPGLFDLFCSIAAK